MKAKIHALLLAAGCAVVPQAQAGWFDWLGEMDASGFYAGGAMNVTKATGQLNRRLGGENDFGEGQSLRIEEPGFITTAILRGGYQLFDFLSVEAHYGFPLDSDRIENDSNSQQFKLKTLQGIYLKPQLNIGESFALFGRLGYTKFDFDVNCYSTSSQFPEPTACGQDENGNAVRSRSFSDSGLGWSGGVQLRLASSTRLAFEYSQHYDEDDVQVFGIGVGVTYLFGGEGGDGYYDDDEDDDDDYY